ncbi:putative tubulin polyglutamylase TTLL2 isoform 1-T2 [Discoglossus pictus]
MADGDDEDNTSRSLVFRLHESAPRVVREVLLERDWKEYDETETEWNLYWRSSSFRAADHDQIKPWQRLNHHQGTTQLTKKDCLARHLKRMKGIYGGTHYEFNPTSFILPNEYVKFLAEYSKEREEKKSSYWICKPVNLSRGRGIFIFNDLKDLSYDCIVIVQKYITNPLLISGYKFDLRIYVCVVSFSPLTVYVYQEGLVRFATEKFSLRSLDNKYAHLTNTSINKNSISYSATKEGVGQGCKWTLGQFRTYLRRLEVDEVLLWQKVYNIITMTLLAIAPSVPSSPNCFELFGFDILIDDTLKPWLLEVNHSPALSLDCSKDVKVKTSLIHDIIDLLNFKTSDNAKDCSSSKMLSNSTHSSHRSCPSTTSRCDNQTASLTNAGTSQKPHPMGMDDDSKCAHNDRDECKQCLSKDSSIQPVPDDLLNKRTVSDRKMTAYPRKTLTSRLRERMNVPERLTTSEIFSKSHSIMSPTRFMEATNSTRHLAPWKTTDTPLFPLYFISDLDKRPPARVGDFILVFPFSQSSLLASKNGTDVKSILQEMNKIIQRILLERKTA